LALQRTYRLLERLATGGMGEVYLAAHRRLPGRFAVKLLHRELIEDEEARARFRTEGEILASLRHPNIVRVVDANFAPDGIPYLVMELVEGDDLGQHEGTPLSPTRVANIVRQIASALQFAHDRGVVHGDLKPENVMLLSLAGPSDFVKVIDFGISTTPRLRPVTSASAVLGTPQFMAPEQAQGHGDRIDHRTDQFALGSIAYTLLAGRAPFRADSAIAVLYQVVHQDPPPLASFVSWRCQEVDAVLRRGLAKDRDARFPRILQLAEELGRAIDEATAPEAIPAPKGEAAARRPFLRAACAAALSGSSR
jgi:eukaryotic-like serine/threonine-protein kinase